MKMEDNLSRWFTIAASWQAIILIDEADVFLERRQGANLQRNSLVSGKHRTSSVQDGFSNFCSFLALHGILSWDAILGLRLIICKLPEKSRLIFSRLRTELGT